MLKGRILGERLSRTYSPANQYEIAFRDRQMVALQIISLNFMATRRDAFGASHQDILRQVRKPEGHDSRWRALR